MINLNENNEDINKNNINDKNNEIELKKDENENNINTNDNIENNNIKNINEENVDNLKINENIIKNDEPKEYREIGVNTDELSKEELQNLIINNQELIELNDEDGQYKELHESKLKMKKELIKELGEKNQIYSLLQKSNNELKNKIEISNIKYNEIVKKIEEKKQNNIEEKLTLQIKELQKEINANDTETERYKKKIEQLKNKLEFKINLEKSSNFSRILKEETLKNSELKKELNSLTRLNKVQNQYIKNIDKDNQITNKIDILKEEISKTKEKIADYHSKYLKLDKFIKLIHEK